jgi:hypothetical protein
MKELLINLFNWLGLAWWVEIVTERPRCTYYFGPFLSGKEAQMAQAGYLEDLQGEGASGIHVEVKRCKPQELTIAEDLGKISSRQPSPAFSAQA